MDLLFSNGSPVARTPAQIRASLDAYVLAANPNYQSTLPGSLIEDIASTVVAAIYQIETAKVDLINSISASTANEQVLIPMAAERGIYRNYQYRSNAYLKFTGTTAGKVIPSGTICTAGGYNWITQEDAIIPSNGGNDTVYAICATDGAINALPNTIVTISPVISGVTVTNVLAAVPGSYYDQTIDSLRYRLVDSLKSPTTGFIGLAKAAIKKVPGVDSRLVSIQTGTGFYRIFVGGGDRYAVAKAIFDNFFYMAYLTYSATDSARNVGVNITDGSDTYLVKYVQPLQQPLSILLTFKTKAGTYFDITDVTTLAKAAFINHVNALPINSDANLNEIKRVFTESIAELIDPSLITNIALDIRVNFVAQTPATGYEIIPAPAESYWYIASNQISITDGGN